MVQCKTVLSVIGFFILLFFGIPIRVDPPPVAHNETSHLFDNYIKKFNKTYSRNETLRLQRYTAFQVTLKEIEALNSQRKYNSSAVFGITKYSDMSKDEFLEEYLLSDMYTRITNSTYRDELHSSEAEDSGEDNNSTVRPKLVKRNLNNLPDKVDWRNKKVVTKVNNQKNCGACWAFSAVETIESMNAIKHAKLEHLSVQELIDCAGYNNQGCNGGDICTLLFWIADNNIKIRKENEYPLHLKTETCKYDQDSPGVEVANFNCETFVNNENALLQKLATEGPVAVAINAMLWQNYLGGVIHYHCNGSPVFLNHAVQIVGYDKTAEVPHYIVRNSWGTNFGDNGYLYIAIGGNFCGISNEVISLHVV